MYINDNIMHSHTQIVPKIEFKGHGGSHKALLAKFYIINFVEY